MRRCWQPEINREYFFMVSIPVGEFWQKEKDYKVIYYLYRWKVLYSS